MKKSTKISMVIILIIIIILVVLYLVTRKNNKNKEEEIQPEEEISIAEEREAMISLYFRNKETKTIEPEARLIDVKELVKDPYKTLLNLLIAGPKNDNFETVMPAGTIVNEVKREKDTLIIDLSNEFIENNEKGKESEEQIMASIVKTLTELTEINSIKITINGQENQAFNDKAVGFENVFTRPE